MNRVIKFIPDRVTKSNSFVLGKSVLFITMGFFCAANTVVLGQGSPQFDRVRALNAEVLRVYGLVQNAAESQRPALRGEAGPLFDQRLKALSNLIEQDPRQALLAAFPADLLAELAGSFPQLQTKLESHGDWHGPVLYLVADGIDPKTSKSIVRMRSNAEDVFLHFADPETPTFKSSDVLSVHGVRAANRIAVEQAQVTPVEAAPGCSTIGAQNILVILANLKSSSLPASMTANAMRGIMLGNSGGGDQNTPDWSVDDFWQQNSDGKTWINRSGAGALTIVGPYNLPGDYDAGDSCDYTGTLNAAWAAADPDVDFRNYSRAVVVVPNNGPCNWWAGVATLSCATSPPGDGPTLYSWTLLHPYPSRQDGVELTTHELGHNLTMDHSNWRKFGSEALGPLGAAGTSVEYGDYFSSMGLWNLGFYNADHAIDKLNWLESGTNYLDVNTSGAYSIQWYGTRPAGLKALRIQRGTEADNAKLIVEFRRSKGIYDSTLRSQVFTGALIHYRDSYTRGATDLLDFTAGSLSDQLDPALAVGQTWADRYTGLSIKVDSIVNDMLNLTVTYGVTPCSRAIPTVTIDPINITAQAGRPATYRISVKNNDTSVCAAATFALSSTLPNGWPPGVFSPPSLAINPGSLGTSDFTLTSPATAALGTYPFNAVATNAAGGLAGTGTASFTVIFIPPPFTIGLDVPASSYALNATVPITVTVKIGTTLVSGATVKYTLVLPNGQKVYKTLTSGLNGKTKWNYKATAKGFYSVSALATKGTQKATSRKDTFTVK